MTPKRFKKITEALDKRQNSVTLVLDMVHKGRNLSAIMRSADAYGIDKVHCVEPKEGFKHYRGTALGSHKWVQVERYESIQQPLTTLKANGYQIIATHLSESSYDYRQIDYTQPTAVILGTENSGVSDVALESIDRCITIPMVGMADSFNVSVACGIILAEIYQQRHRAGLYNTRQLSDDEYRKRLFQWCYPDLALFCDERGYQYPNLDEKGSIVNGPEWYTHKKNQASGGERLDKTIRSKL